MVFDFATPPSRLHTDSQKWQKYQDRDILPLWVADMDFLSPPAVLEALHRRVDHGIFGYARPTSSTVAAFLGHCERRYAWQVHPEWLVWLPGLVVGLNLTAQAFAEPGDEVLCLTPVYPPFMSAPRNSGRFSKQVPLYLNKMAGRWEIDWDALEQAVSPRTKIFFLCNPHNPVGRVFTREELLRLGDFCLRHGLLLCSDEIHCDLILEALNHVPRALLGKELAQHSMTLMAPSKTFNVPGLGTSLAIIPDPQLRARFLRASAGIVAEVTCLGFTAAEAAFSEGEAWRLALLKVLRSNRDLLFDFLKSHPSKCLIEAPIEATYLAWLRVSSLQLKDPVAHFEAHGLGLSDGSFFGAPKGDYVRLNFGCPRSTLEEALSRLNRALAC